MITVADKKLQEEAGYNRGILIRSPAAACVASRSLPLASVFLTSLYQQAYYYIAPVESQTYPILSTIQL